MKKLGIILGGAAFLIATAAYVTSTFSQGNSIGRQTPSLPGSWVVEQVTNGSVPDIIVPDKREKAPNGLPDGRIDVVENSSDIVMAYYSEPTTRYTHAVLGDGIEAGALKVITNRGENYTFRLPRTEVFEDITPRLVDLDGNGTTEVVTILSLQEEGASVAVFGLNGNAFVKIAQSRFIGRGNRWLNIAGIDNFTGRPNKEIAVIETPHLAGLFKLYSFSAGSSQLTTPGAVPGFSNHGIGSRELRLSATALVDNDRQPDIILPSLDRSSIYIVSVKPNQLQLLARIDLPARVDRAIKAEGNGEALKITVGLNDGKIYRISRPQTE